MPQIPPKLLQQASLSVFQQTAPPSHLALCADAYDKTLALIHTWVVRAGIKTGMLGLPSTETFFKSIGETRECTLGRVFAFAAFSRCVVARTC
jgi:hypothetical protein